MKQYKNRDWLYKKYWNESLSATQIAELYSCGETTIGKWLRKFSIPIRSHSEARHLARGNHCNLSEEAREWLDGEIIGDGCLWSCSKYSARFAYGSKYKEYIQYVSDILKSFGIKQGGKIIEHYYKEMDCYTYHYQSLSYEELRSIRKRWYPENKKIIPRDLELTPLVCRQWYIGDGCLHHQEKGRPHITLSTEGFPISDVEWLVEQLNKLGFKSARQPSKNTTRISTYSTKQFLDYIGKSPVDCYNYKFNY